MSYLSGMKAQVLLIFTILNVLTLNMPGYSQGKSGIDHDDVNKTVTLSACEGNLVIRLNYSGGCTMDLIKVQGNEVTGNGSAVFTGIQSGGLICSSRESLALPVVSISRNSVTVDSLKFGTAGFTVKEKWIFTAEEDGIQWRIEREYLNDGIIEDNFLPCWKFKSMQTWDGAMMDNGGVAWNRFLANPGESYGAHAASLVFWNRARNICLNINADTNPGLCRTATFSHQDKDVYSVAQSLTEIQRDTRYGLYRFRTNGEKIFAPVSVSQSKLTVQYKLSVSDYDRQYDLGALAGINESSIREMFNTIGRYGVVDENLFGSNGWRTGWTVLQEPWLALYGLANHSPEFINGFSRALEYAKDEAVLPDGRVLPRWHHDSTDAMPGTFRSNGFYECVWGYMLDAQPAFAINVAEQFDLTGDVDWLRNFKPTCEKVLEYMIRRDSDGDGLFEVVQKTRREEKGTDWYDVVWASWEVASINAYMYLALTRWAGLEELLGDRKMSDNYHALALKLKTAFNKNINEGGFWDPGNKWYVHWREPDGSVYGSNLNTMVNFLAIGYGLCDDQARRKRILDKMEELMVNEKLFIWPSVFFPYEENVGLKNVNYPWPNYENGDLFLAWAGLGVRSYAAENPEIALKYIRNVIARYESDGLAHQRYTRLNQSGAGDDILSNNIMAVISLYRDIYGIRPQYNRLYLEPHLPAELNGTGIGYWLRNQEYLINFEEGKYCISTASFSLSTDHPFAVNFSDTGLEYFNGEDDTLSLSISGTRSCSVRILEWGNDVMTWEESGKSRKVKIHHEMRNMEPGKASFLVINGKTKKELVADQDGSSGFDSHLKKNVATVRVVRK